MGKVRKQVATVLGSSQQGELLDLKKFLEDFAGEQLAEERAGFRLGPGDVSDDDDYPGEHFATQGFAAGTKKPSRAERLTAFKRSALRDFKDGNGRTALHFAGASNAAGTDDVARFILGLLPEAHAVTDDNGATPLVLAAGVAGGGDHAARMVELLLAAGAAPDAADKCVGGVQPLTGFMILVFFLFPWQPWWRR